MPEKRKPNELRITRVYDAPIALVWEAWADPEKAALWWGPRGFTLTTHSKDLRPGGHWRYTMHGPDGTDYPNHTIYHEVKRHERLVYDHGGYDDRPPLFRVTVEFRETGGKTKMVMTMALPTPEAAEQTKSFIKKAGGNGTWDRLAEYLEESAGTRDLFVINRSFAAPIEKIFEMWVNPEHLARWLPPTGFSMAYREADIRPGGSALYSMTNGGVTLRGRMRYLEIDPPHRLVYTQQFLDERGQLSRHPALPTWPATMLSTVTFAEEEEGQTRVTVIWEPHGEASAAERSAFRDFRGSMTAGWTGSFDKLDELIRA